MRKTLTLAFALMGTFAAKAQTVATFDTLTLSGTDTFYVNYSDPGNDVGFTDAKCHFETLYDTAGYSGLRRGFVFSNMTDSVTSGFTNQFSAKTAVGYNGSAQYAVAYAPAATKVRVLDTAAVTTSSTTPNGFYVTNNTYAYNSMRDGDGFAKKFGGVPNVDPDWFKLTIKAYHNGSLKTDSVDFYLADFRDPDSTKDYIIKTWEWVDLQPLGTADSLLFSLSSSDVGSFGMNTPAYFCVDDFTVTRNYVTVNDVVKQAAKVYPNPATDRLYIELLDNTVEQVHVFDMSGKLVGQYNAAAKIEVNTSALPSGVYLLQMKGFNGTAVARFTKQ